MRIGVVGGGLMGSGIAEVCARAGVDVTVVEADDGAAERARARIEKSLDRGVRSGKLSAEDREAAAERLAYTCRIDDLEGSDAAIEAIIENEAAKRELFTRLDAVLPDADFLASNTSSVPIMKLGAGTSKPERVLGLHFFNPVPGAAAGRGRALDHDRRRGDGERARPSRRTRSARSASTPRTGPASSSTRC